MVRHNKKWFDAAFGQEIPDAIRRPAETFCQVFNIQGSSDPMYIANVIAFNLGLGDGRGSFNEVYKDITKDQRALFEEVIVPRLIFAYTPHITDAGVDADDVKTRKLIADMLQASFNAKMSHVPSFKVENGRMTTREWYSSLKLPNYSGVACDLGMSGKQFVLTMMEDGERTINYLQAKNAEDAFTEADELRTFLAAHPVPSL